MNETDINEYRRQRLATLERDNQRCREENEMLYSVLGALLAMCQRSGHDWQPLLLAAHHVATTELADLT